MDPRAVHLATLIGHVEPVKHANKMTGRVVISKKKFAFFFWFDGLLFQETYLKLKSEAINAKEIILEKLGQDAVSYFEYLINFVT